MPYLDHFLFWNAFLLRLTNIVHDSYDKSASNICESRIWTTIGQTPWADPYSIWYHRYVEFPFQALRAAIKLGEYTLVDRGTWCSIDNDVTNKLEVFVSCKAVFRQVWRVLTSGAGSGNGRCR